MADLGSDSTQSGAKERRYKFRDAVLSDVGLRRNENQDSFSIVHSSGTSLYVVADGMGGARGGATASSIAVSVIAKHAFTDTGMISRPSLKKAIELANTAIFQRSKRDEDLAGMGTTVVALAFVKDVALIAHVGDSRIYHIRVDSVRQLTRDHTLVQELVDSGAIPPEEAESHPIAHMLTRSLGPAEEVEVEIQALGETLEPGDKFLLCSDGLYNLVNEKELLDAVSTKAPQEAVRTLVDLALERGGTDNVTVEIIEVVRHNDDSLQTDYPVNGELKQNYSELVDFGGMDKLLTEVADYESKKKAVEQKSGDLVPGEEEISSDVAALTSGVHSLDSLVESALPVESVPGALPQVESQLEKNKFQPGMFFVVGLAAGILALAVFQFQNYNRNVAGVLTTSGNNSQSSSSSGADVNSNKESDNYNSQLEKWASQGGQPATEELPSVPDLTVDSPEIELAGGPDNSSDLLKDYLAQLTIPPPPKVIISADSPGDSSPSRPIVWEHESKRVEKLLKRLEEQTPKVKSTQTDLSELSSMVSLFSEDELNSMSEEKEKIRERVNDLDTKLELLMLQDKEEIDKEFAAVKTSVAGLDRLLSEKRATLESLKSDIARWSDYQTAASSKKLSDLALRVDQNSAEFIEKKEAFDKASAGYFSAVDAWEKSPSDMKLASEMGAQGRKLQALRAEYELAIKNSISNSHKEAVLQAVDSELELNYLERYLARLSRKEGFLTGFTVANQERRSKLKEAFINERTAIIERFNSLESKFSADEEMQFRKKSLLKKFQSR